MDPVEYDKKELTLNQTEVTFKGLLLGCISILVFGLPYGIIWSDSIRPGSILPALSISNSFVILLLAGIFIHELIHGISWSFFVPGGFRSIKIGVMWKYLTPYCHCKQPMKVKHYRIGVIMPTVLLGFLPAISGLILGKFALTVYGILYTIAGGGDLLMMWVLRKEEKEAYVSDHPSKVGCIIYNRPIPQKDSP